MLGAASLTTLSAMRSGAGLVTLGIPQSLNLTAQKKISNVVMTLPLEETSEQTTHLKAWRKIKNYLKKCNAVAVGPGLSTHSYTKQLVLKLISDTDLPMVIDADGLNNMVGRLDVLKKHPFRRILTPHNGEMSRLLNLKVKNIEAKRNNIALDLAKRYQCVVLLKGPHTVIASYDGKIYLNKTGNAGMATAGSGDVLTGIIAAFLAQGLNCFESAKYGTYLHGLAGDIAAKSRTRVSLIASDIFEYLPQAFKKCKAV